MGRPLGRRWLVGVLVGAHTLAFAGVAAGQERLRAGTTELTLAGGYSVSHKIGGSRDLEAVNGLHLLPHFGYVLSDEHGPGWVRGNFELLAEPTGVHLEDGDAATVAGLAVLGRWVFAVWPTVRPYFEVGVGVVGGQVELRHTNCDVNFLVEGGPGMLFFVSSNTAVTVGYRFHHMSNAQRCSQDLGLNSSLFTVGVSYFFP